MPRFQEVLALFERIGDDPAEANAAGNLGNTYLLVPELRDLDQAEHWFRISLSLRDDADWFGRARNFSSLGAVALERFEDAQAAGQSEPILLGHLNAALRVYQQALDLTPADDHDTRAACEHQLGIINRHAGDTRRALRHFQQSIQHEEARGNIYGAGQTRHGIAILLSNEDRIGEALLYAHAALDNYRQAGPGAAADAASAEQLIARLEQHTQPTAT